MSETREKILAEALTLFSQRGYSAVSIRDICKTVAIKESSVYYHFKNKQAIFDALMERFQQKAEGMMKLLENSLVDGAGEFGNGSYMTVCSHFFEGYLMDDFCNKVIRLMSIEQFHQEKIRTLYRTWMIDRPILFQTGVFQSLMELRIVQGRNSEYLAVRYYAPVFFLGQKWLFSGPLTEEHKNEFRKAAYEHVRLFFAEIGGMND